mgnify:CR=1 FL=1
MFEKLKQKLESMQQSSEETKPKEDMDNLRKILENHPFIPGLKSLFNKHSKSEIWENMLPPFYPLLSSQVSSIENQLKEFGTDLKLYLEKT